MLMGGTLNLDGGMLTLDGGTHPPYNLSTGTREGFEKQFFRIIEQQKEILQKTVSWKFQKYQISFRKA